MMFVLILSTLSISTTILASVGLEPTTDLSVKYHEGVNKQIVHLNGSPLCIAKPTTADARNRVLNLLAHKICARKHFGTYQLIDSERVRARTRHVDCRLSRDEYKIQCYFENSLQNCQHFIEVKCKSCHREDTVSTFKAVTLRNPLFPRLVPGWACTYDVTLENQYLLHKTKMVLKILNLSLPPANYAVTPGRPQCIESYIQILQGSDLESLSVVATLCDVVEEPLFYNITQPNVQIRFVSGNLFYPDLTGFSIIVSAYHEFSVPHGSKERNWKYFLPLVILIFFVIVFCIGIIFCIAVLCSEGKRKLRSGTRPSWQMTPPHPLEVRTRPARGTRPPNPSSRENAYIVDNTRPRTVAENPGTASIQQRSLPSPPGAVNIQQRSLPNPPSTALSQNCSNRDELNSSDGYMSVNWNNQSGIYMNETSQLETSMDGTDNLVNFVNRNQLDISMNRLNQSANSMDRTNESCKAVNRFNQSNQSIISRIFSVKARKSCLSNSEYLDMTGSSDSDFYINMNPPPVPRRPTWTYDDSETQDKQIYQVPVPVYLTVVNSPEKVPWSKLELSDKQLLEAGGTLGTKMGEVGDNVFVNNMGDINEGVYDDNALVNNTGDVNDRLGSTTASLNLDQSMATKETVEIVENENIASIDLIPDDLNLKPSIANNVTPQETILLNEADEEIRKETPDMVQSVPRISTGIAPDEQKDMANKSETEDIIFDEDMRVKRNAHKCAMSQLKRKIRNSYRSVSSKIENYSISSGGFTYWEIDREDLLQDDHKMDDVFGE